MEIVINHLIVLNKAMVQIIHKIMDNKVMDNKVMDNKVMEKIMHNKICFRQYLFRITGIALLKR